MSFERALAAQIAAGDAMDASRPRPWLPPEPHMLAEFNDACLGVRRAIHREHPDLYGDPDDPDDQRRLP